MDGPSHDRGLDTPASNPDAGEVAQAGVRELQLQDERPRRRGGPVYRGPRESVVRLPSPSRYPDRNASSIFVS